MKRLLIALLGILLLGVTLSGCSSTSGGGVSITDTFNNPDCMRATLASLEAFLNANNIAQPTPTSAAFSRITDGEWTGPETATAVCDVDGSEYTVTFYYKSSTSSNTTTFQFYATSTPDHGGTLGSASNPCWQSITTNADGSYTLNYDFHGTSATLHPPVQDFTFTCSNGLVSIDVPSHTATINITFNFTFKNHTTGAAIITGSISLVGTIDTSTGASDTRTSITCTDSVGAQLLLVLDPTDATINSHIVNSKPAIGYVQISGTASYDNTYYFNEDGDYSPTPPWLTE